MNDSMREQGGGWDEFIAGRILLAAQGSEEAAGVAVKVAKAIGFDLHVAHVKLLPLAPPYPEVLGQREERPAEEIVTLAGEIGADLIVLGSRGREGIRTALTGSVSDRVVRHAPCPVLVVRSPGDAEAGAGCLRPFGRAGPQYTDAARGDISRTRGDPW